MLNSTLSRPMVKADRPARSLRVFAEGLLPETMPSADTLPADVRAVRVTLGHLAGTYNVATDPGVLREFISTDGKGRRVLEHWINRAYSAGHVAILPAPVAVAPISPVRPAPPAGPVAPIRPTPATALDVAEHEGYSAALEDAAPIAPARYDAARRAAWMAGWTRGTKVLAARVSDWADEQAALEAERAEAGWGCLASEGR